MSHPERIGKYEIEQPIGEGAFGIVYKGRDPYIRRRVAIKVCTARDEALRRRFLREAEIAGNLYHRHITTIYEFGFDDNAPYLVQEYLTGEDLKAKIQRRDPLSPGRRVKYLLEIARGLAYAHSQGVLHRDVKPGNVRVLDNDQVKLMDFGIARLASAETALTQLGSILGTPGYLSPEQVLGREADERSDVFAFGALAYELLTYRKPFRGDGIDKLLRDVLQSDPPSVQTAWPECPPALAALVKRCLEKDPAERYQGFEPIIQELSAIFGRLRSHEPPEVEPPEADEESGTQEIEPEVAASAAAAAGLETGVVAGRVAGLDEPPGDEPASGAASPGATEPTVLRAPEATGSEDGAPGASDPTVLREPAPAADSAEARDLGARTAVHDVAPGARSGQAPPGRTPDANPGDLGARTAVHDVAPPPRRPPEGRPTADGGTSPTPAVPPPPPPTVLLGREPASPDRPSPSGSGPGDSAPDHTVLLDEGQGGAKPADASPPPPEPTVLLGADASPTGPPAGNEEHQGQAAAVPPPPPPPGSAAQRAAPPPAGHSIPAAPTDARRADLGARATDTETPAAPNWDAPPPVPPIPPTPPAPPSSTSASPPPPAGRKKATASSRQAAASAVGTHAATAAPDRAGNRPAAAPASRPTAPPATGPSGPSLGDRFAALAAGAGRAGQGAWGTLRRQPKLLAAIAGGLALVLLVALVAVFLFGGGEEAVTAVEETAPVLEDEVVRPPGQVLVQALPWGEVAALRGTDGEARPVPADAATPLVLELPPGEYEIELRHPAAEGTSTCRVEVSATGSASPCVVQLLEATPRDYFRDSGWWP